MRWITVLLLLCLRSSIAQAPQAQGPGSVADGLGMLSPQSAYDQASTPIDITRRNKANWSEIEKAALAVAVDKAKEACLTRGSVKYTGDDLISYARLCDLGQQWKIVYTAATTYINSKDVAKPQLEQAYAFEVVADLNMQQWQAASHTCFAMLRSVPYGALTDEVTTTTIRYLQFAYLGDALDLSAQRQPYLLKLIQGSQAGGTAAADASGGQTAAAGVVSAQSSATAIPLHMLVRHALDYAALQAYNKQPELAAYVIADIDKAMPEKLPPDEAIFIAADRRQYALIGTHFPELPGAVSLLSPTASHRVNPGAVTIFLLFPPWCAQCVRQEHEMAPALFHASENGVHMYGLLADNPPPAMKPAVRAAAVGGHSADAGDKPEAPKSAAEQLRGTPTLVVAPSTLADFNATDFPFLIATDHDGMIRLMVSAAPDNALVKDGPIDQIVDTILAGWPAAVTGEPTGNKSAGAATPAKPPVSPTEERLPGSSLVRQ